MTETELFEFVKLQLRIFGNDFDDEIKALIEAGETDIEQSTGKVFDSDSYMQACTLVAFVKSRFFADDISEKYETVYQRDLAKLGIQRMG